MNAVPKTRKFPDWPEFAQSANAGLGYDKAVLAEMDHRADNFT